MPTRSPEMAPAPKVISSKEPSTSAATRYTVGNSWETSTATVPMETKVESVTLQSTAISLPHLPMGVMAPEKSTIEGTAATEMALLSPSPSEAGINPHAGTSKSLGPVSSVSLESTLKGTTGIGQQSSPALITETTGMNSSPGSTGGTTVETHVSLSTSSTYPEDAMAISGSLTTQKGTTSAVADKSEFITKTWVSTTVIPSTALSKKTVTAEQASLSVGESYSSASPLSEQIAGRDLTLSVSPEGTDTLNITSIGQTTLGSLTPESQATTSLTNASGEKMSSSPSVTFPSVETESLVATTGVVVSTPEQLSQTSPPAGVSTMDVTTALTSGVTTAMTTMGTNSFLTAMPDPEGSVSGMESALATETSTSARQDPPTWSSITASAPTAGPWTITNMASILDVTGSPDTTSAMGTTSSSASSMDSGSVSTPHDLVTVIGASLAVPSSYVSAEKTEASTRRTLGPSDTTASITISTSSAVKRISTSIPDILSTSGTPSRRETEMPVSMASTDHSNTKTDPSIVLPTPLPDSLSTLDWATRTSVSSATISTLAPQWGTAQPELPLENVISPMTSQLPLSVGDITSGFIPAAMVSSSRTILLGRPDLASKEAEKSSTQLLATTSVDPGYVPKPEATTPDVISYTVRTPDPTSQGPGLRTRTTEARATSDSWMGRKDSTSSTYMNAEMTSVSSVSGGATKEVMDSPGLLRSTDLSGISLESRTTSPPSWTKSTSERRATSEPTTDKEVVHPSTNTPVWVIRSEYDPHLTVPVHSESSRAIHLMDTASTMVKIIVSTSTTTWPESTRAGMELGHSLTPELRDSSAYMDTNSTTETNIVPSPSSTAVTKESRTKATTSDRTFSQNLPQPTRSSDITRTSTRSAMVESERNIIMKTGPSGTTSLGTPTLTVLFPQSEITTLMSKGPEDVSWANPPSVEETISPSSLAPSSATNSLSHVLLTSPGHSPSSTLPVTFGLGKTTDMLRTSLEPDTSLPPNWSSTSGEILASYKAATDLEAVHPSTHTAVTDVGTTSSGYELHSPIPAHTQPSQAIPPMITSSTKWAITSSTLRSGSSETTKIEREPVSSLNPGLREVSTYQEPSSAAETSTVISNVSTGDATTDVTRIQVTSSSRMSSPSPAHVKTFPDILTESSTTPSTSLFVTEPAEMIITTQANPPAAATQSALVSGTLTKASWAGTPSAVTQGFPQSERSKGPEDVSWTNPPPGEESSSPSSLEPTLPTTSTSPAAFMLQGHRTFSPVSETSDLTSGLVKTAGTLSTNLELVTSTPESVSNISDKTLATSQATTNTETMHSSASIAVPNMGTTSSENASHSTVPANSESYKATSPMVTSSTIRDTTVSTSMPDSSETTRIKTESVPSLVPELRETSTYQENRSSIETNTVFSSVSTGASTEVSRTEVPSFDETLMSASATSTRTPHISSETSSGHSTSPPLTISTHVAFTTQTSPSGAPSLGTLTLDTSTISTWTETPSAVTQSITHSEATTLIKTDPKNMSWTSPLSEKETNSPSLAPIPAMTSTSLVSSTLQRHSPSSSLSVSSVPTSGLVKTTGMLVTSLETGASSPPSLSNASSEAITDKEKIHDSTKTGVSNVGTTSSRHESRSFVPTDSEPSKAISPIITTSIMGDTTISTSMPGFSETKTEIETSSSSTPGVKETSPSKETSSYTESNTVLPDVNTGATTEVSRTEVISSSGILSPGPAHSTVLPVISTETITRLLTSPIMTGSAEMTIARQTGHLGATLLDALPLDTSTTAYWSQTPLALTQGIPHSEMTTFMNRGPENVSWMSPPVVEETSSPSSLMPLSAMTSPSPVFSTLLSSPTPGTSLHTLSLAKTADTLGTSPEPRTRLPPNLSNTSDEILAISKDTTPTEIIHPATYTAVPNVGTTSSGYKYSSVLELSETISPTVTAYTAGDTIVSTLMSASSEVTEIEREPISSLTPGMKETSASQENMSSTETSIVLSSVSTGAATQASRTEVTSFDESFMPASATSTRSSDISSESRNRLSTSPLLTLSTKVPFSTQIDLSGATSLGALSLAKSTTASLEGTPLSVPWGLGHAEMTTISNSSKDVSRMSSPVEKTRSPSVGPISATTSPSPISPTLAGRSPSSPTPVTSLVSPGLVKTTDMSGLSLKPVTSSSSSLVSTTVEILATSDASTEAIYISKITAVNNVGTTNSGHESHSSVPADSGPSKATSPMVTSSAIMDTTASISTSGSSETTRIDTESASSLIPGLRETSTSQQMSSATETITGLSKMPTGGPPEVSRAEVISSSRTSISGPAQSTMTPHIPAGIFRLSTSPVMAEPSAMTIATQRSPHEATSQGTPPLDTSTTASMADTNLAVSQGSAHLETIALMSRVPEDVSGKSTSSQEEASLPSSLVPSPAMTSPSPVSSRLPGNSSNSLTPVTSLLTSGLVKTTDMSGISFELGAISPPSSSSTSIETLTIFKGSIDTEAAHLSKKRAMATVGTTSSGHELHSSVPVHSESPRVTSPMGTASSMEETTATASDTEPLWHLTPGLRETSTAQDFSSATPTHMPPSPQSTHLSKSPRAGATYSVKTSVPDQPPSLQSTEIPVETVTHFYAPLSVTRPADITSFQESKISVPVSESDHHLGTDILSSADTIPGDTLTLSLSGSMASFATSGVLDGSSAAFSFSPFSRTESVPGDATKSTIARSPPSSASTPFPSSTFSTMDSSTSSAPHGVTASPAATHTADTTLGKETSATEGPLVMVSALETWTQPVRTSLPPIMDTRITENVDLQTVTSASQVSPLSTGLTRLPARGTERAETTSTAIMTTRVSTPTVGKLTLLRTPGNTASTSTTGVTITTPDVSPDALEMTASLETQPGTETSMAISRTTTSMFNTGSETTPALVLSSGAETSSSGATLTVSLTEPDETSDSRVTHLVGTGTAVSRATLTASHSEPDSISPMATSSEEEVSLAVPTPTVSPGVPEMVTSLVSSPEAETSMVFATLTGSTKEPQTTASWITHPGSQASSIVPTLTVYPADTDKITSSVYSARNGTGVSRTIPNASHSKSDSTFSKATSPLTEASSDNPNTTLSPSVSGVVTSLVTSTAAEASTTFTTPTITPHKTETTASWITKPGSEDSSKFPTLILFPGDTDTRDSWVHSEGTAIPVTITMPNATHSESDSTPSTATSPATEASSDIPNASVTPGVSGVVTSLVTSSGAEASTTFPTPTDSPESTASGITHPRSQLHCSR
ncbi:mucin-16 [Rhinolophus sinicus]|uniref:mucin-16 n=1 Tax=Rhinolophus sinicus TaxID=89399 RepID=UPI003D79B394